MKPLKDVNHIKFYEVSKQNPIYIKLDFLKEEKLYHYTSMDAANNIFEKSCFWVTRSDSLKDKTEIKYICKVLKGVISYLDTNKELFDLGVGNQYIVLENIIRTLKGIVTVYERYGVAIKEGHLYILSLTEDKDNQYLKENYSADKGAILEIKNNFKHMNGGSGMCIFCAKVVYDYEEQKNLIIEDINDFYRELIYNLLDSDTKINFMEVVETIKTVLYIKIINYSFFFKDKIFAYERESRVMFMLEDKYNNKCVKYRMMNGQKIPYIKVYVNKGDIKIIKRFNNTKE